MPIKHEFIQSDSRTKEYTMSIETNGRPLGAGPVDVRRSTSPTGPAAEAGR